MPNNCKILTLDEVPSNLPNTSLELVTHENGYIAEQSSIEVTNQGDPEERNFFNRGTLRDLVINRQFSDAKMLISKYNFKKTDLASLFALELISSFRDQISTDAILLLAQQNQQLVTSGSV